MEQAWLLEKMRNEMKATHDNEEHEKLPDHDSVVADWHHHSKESDDINFQFLRNLKIRDYGFRPDELAGELHEKAFQIVDCTRCANCCRTANVTLDQDDIDRISKHLGLGTQEFTDKYLEPHEQEGMFAMRQKPCPLLGDDNLCTVYDVRPAGCREYPHTDKEGFTTRTFGHAQNALICPAVFWIVEKMRQRAMG